MKAFDIKVNGKILDYRISAKLNLKKVEAFFEKKYKVHKLWQESRHVLGIVEKDGKELFLKLSTTEGIGAETEIEYKWNDEFNKLVSRQNNFWVPINFEQGFYNNLFYFTSDIFKGAQFAEKPNKNTLSKFFYADIEKIIDLTELIQELDVNELSEKDLTDYKEWFWKKTLSWFEAIPQDIKNLYEIKKLLNIVEYGYQKLEKKTRHGDFTPWHLFKLQNGKIGLIDGEHAMKNGVEYYDSCYLIQRVFSVLEEQEFAKQIYQMLVKRFYDEEKMKVVLSARAIGGFLDESLKEKPNYKIAEEFKNWILTL